MTFDLACRRRCRRFALALGLGFTAAAAQAQSPPSPSGVDWDAPAAEQAQAPETAPSRPSRARTRIQPYLEVAQVVSAELDGGDTLTYTSLAAGVDGQVHTRRVTVSMSYRYQRNIEWGSDVGDTDMHSGLAMLNAQIIPGTLQFDAGALATRTGGEGRLFGVTSRDSSVEVYSVFAGPTLSTQAGPVGVNAAYRLGYVAIDDDTGGTGLREDYDSAISHAASLGVGMAPGRLPFGWGVNAGYQRTDFERRVRSRIRRRLDPRRRGRAGRSHFGGDCRYRI